MTRYLFKAFLSHFSSYLKETRPHMINFIINHWNQLKCGSRSFSFFSFLWKNRILIDFLLNLNKVFFWGRFVGVERILWKWNEVLNYYRLSKGCSLGKRWIIIRLALLARFDWLINKCRYFQRIWWFWSFISISGNLSSLTVHQRSI